MILNGWKGLAGFCLLVLVASMMTGCVGTHHERNRVSGRYIELNNELKALYSIEGQGGKLSAAQVKRILELNEADFENNTKSDQTLYNLVRANERLENWNKAAYWSEKLLALLNKEGVVRCGKGKTRTAISAAELFWRSGEVEKARTFAELANKLAKEIGDDQPDCSSNKFTHDDAWVRTEASTLADRLSSIALKPLEIEVKKSGPVNKKYANSIGMEFVYIPPGSFIMGDDKGKTEANKTEPHSVTLSQGYWLQTTEVTQEQWQKVMGTLPSTFKGRTNPVETVSWEDARTFIDKLNAKEKTLAYRLPSEAEWEYATRAGTNTTYFFGEDEDKLAQYAWYGKNAGDNRTHPVAARHPNQWGLYDMLGNVAEWVEDCWHGNYDNAPSDGSVRKTDRCDWHIWRGSSFASDFTETRPAFRGSDNAIERKSAYGFRLVMMDTEAIEDYWYKQRADEKYLNRFPKGKYAAAINEKKRKAEEEKLKHNEQLVQMGLNAGKIFRDCPDCPEMVVIPAGSFTMGSPETEAGRKIDEGPQHRVIIVKAFAMSKYEVTVGEYRVFARVTGYRTDAEKNVGAVEGCETWDAADGKIQYRAGRYWDQPGFTQADRQPAVCLSWNDARAYVEWLAKKTGKDYRMPSEAEWEYSARSGTTMSRYWGNEPNQACRYANVTDQSKTPAGNFWPTRHECSDDHFFSAAVGNFEPNAFGLFDMIGNAYEWSEDCFHDNYSGAPADGSVWNIENCGRRVLRGGSWGADPPSSRSAGRFVGGAAYRTNHTGFRPARILP